MVEGCRDSGLLRQRHGQREITDLLSEVIVRLDGQAPARDQPSSTPSSRDQSQRDQPVLLSTPRSARSTARGNTSLQRFGERLELFRPTPYDRRTNTRESGKKKKRTKTTIWQHDFVCLSSRNQCTPPSPFQRASLLQAGLGLKSVSFIDCSDSDKFHSEILEEFPQLHTAGGQDS